MNEVSRVYADDCRLRVQDANLVVKSNDRPIPLPINVVNGISKTRSVKSCHVILTLASAESHAIATIAYY